MTFIIPKLKQAVDQAPLLGSGRWRNVYKFVVAPRRVQRFAIKTHLFPQSIRGGILAKDDKESSKSVVF